MVNLVFDIWVIKGITMGYPPCCIRAFTDGSTFDSPHYNYEFLLHGTGFVPCVSCNNRDKQELVKEINEHRQLNYRFPNLEKGVRTSLFMLDKELSYDIENNENKQQCCDQLKSKLKEHGTAALPERYKELADILFERVP